MGLAGGAGGWGWRVLLLCVSRSVVSDSLQPWTIPRQAPLSMEFLRQEYWSGLPFPFPGDLPDPGMEPQISCRQIVYQLCHQGGLVLLRVPLLDLQVFSKISFHVVDHNDFNFLFSSPDIYLQMLGHCFSLLDKKLMFFSEV